MESTHETALEQANVILRYFLGTFAVDLQHQCFKATSFFQGLEEFKWRKDCS
jgi:hypothetical protein